MKAPTTDIDNNLDVFQKHAEQKKPDKERVHTIWAYLNKILEKEKLIHRKPISSNLWWGPQGICLLTEGGLRKLLDDAIFYILVVVIWVYMFSKTYGTEYK